METTVTRPAAFRVNHTVHIPLFSQSLMKACSAHAGTRFVPGTRHQNVVLKMAAALLHHVESANLGHVLHAPCDVFLSRETVFRPDILFVRNNRRGIIGQKHLCGMPDLVIEVLPHHHQTTDFQAKKRVCSRYGIQEFWAVDFAREKVEILLWSELGYICMGGYSKPDRLSSPLLPNLNLPLSRIFARRS
jgi:Uma2 family endonuclease